MKKYTLLFVALLATAFSLFAQEKYVRVMEIYMNDELIYRNLISEDTYLTFPLVPLSPTQPSEIDIPNGTLTVPQANAICSTLNDGTNSGNKFYVKGWVKEILPSSGSTRTFYLAEHAYIDDTFSDETFLAYQVNYLDNQPFIEDRELNVGDYVVIYGELTNDKKTYRTVGDGQAHVYSSDNRYVAVRSISINESIILLAGDEAVQLDLSCEPTWRQLLPSEVEWTSSNESIVTVDVDGNVQGLAAGEAIVTAKYRNLSAVCNITVIADERELFTWGGMHLIRLGNPMSEDTITVLDGDEEYKCLIHSGLFYFTDANISTDANNQFVGEGYVSVCYAPIYVIYGGDYDGYYFSPRKGYRFATSVQDALAGYTSTNVNDIQYAVFPQGITDEAAYTTFIGGLINGTLGYDSPEYEAYSKSMPWGGFQLVDFATGSAYPTEGFLGEGTFIDGTNYDFTVNWLNGAYGLNNEITEEGEVIIIVPYELLPFSTFQYVKNGASSNAPKAAPTKVAKRVDAKGDLKIKKIEPVKVMTNIK